MWLCGVRFQPELLPYGTHHTKMMIMFYPATVRVVIMTANMIAMDWNFMTQGVWYQDFPLKSGTAPGTPPMVHLREL